MDFTLPVDLVVFLVGTFSAAFVTGLAGFAFGMVAAGIWLHVLTPLQTTTLVLAYALLVQGYAVWKLRSTINLRRLLPFVIGSAIGIPGGIAALKLVPATYLRTGVGVLLILHSVYSLLRPKLPEIKQAGSAGDAGVGFLNGLLGGSTGLGGILPTIWCGLRGWTRDEQRAVFQPTAVATFLMSLLAIGGVGLVAPDAVRLFLLGVPALIAGTLLGWALYGKLDDASFRKIVLVLLLVSGLLLFAMGL
ncbi:MAG: sulfite exporter TauE/SafE family protein [Alphaproteobacteria bacterium]|nr:sulfite exporter TauE/SafE family protein [Alphaproteobacteria bacterium]